MELEMRPGAFSRPRALTLGIGKEIPYIGSMITSRLTAKAQTTIPQPVRTALGLQPGDEIAYEIEGGHVVLRRARTGPVEDPFGAFHEWGGAADTEAYGEL